VGEGAHQVPLYTLIALGGMVLGLYIVSTIMFRRQFKRG
jgi:hypothetical protein